ncbi:carboxymuconolactone decarboxylase family protein [Amycolatopsis albispora]|uniref:Carboxymuconolactone decarboxylase-like domain-containing protein n=1 Tax=Amycolatopsis albispora TaxID=1804986 RepID=A0A344LIJ3_9PSEU|nr:carboxymuconolactone decarboxylase family protein [Amycolatopsis albispora]AXB47867.1 hypothetical protein A4R43_39955 [Amycolatopsis albispora]
MPTERMPNPAELLPGAMDALLAVDEVTGAAGLEGGLLALSHLRTSQINGCGHGVAAAVRRALEHGVPERQVHTVAAWRQAPWFSEDERAALALTEAVTRLADHPDPVPDRLWDLAAKYFDHRELAALLLGIASTNAVNRLHAPTRQQAGE